MRSTRAAIAGALWLVLPAAAQTPATSTFVESVEVESAEVQVFVTDRDGRSVSGLEAADFRLLVDGKERPIANFHEARAATLPRPPQAETAEAVAPAASAAVAAEPPPRSLSVSVLIDDLHLNPNHRTRVLERLRPLLEERAAAGDRVLLASFDRTLVVHRSFDAPRNAPVALAKSRRKTAGGLHAEIERRATLSQIRDLQAANGCEAMPEMQAIAAAWAQTVEHEARLSLEALRGLVGDLAGTDGRKALLYVSDGMQLDPGLEARLLLDALCQSGRGTPSVGLAGALAEIVRTANASQVTFYALDAGGQRVLGSAEDFGPGLALAAQAEVRDNAQDTVFSIAVDTGGRALLETNRPELLLADLASDFSTYYSLGFEPLAGESARAHRIAVSARRQGLRLRHRTSWQPLSAAQRTVAALLSTLRLGGVETNPLAARVEIGEPRRQSDGTFLTTLRLAVPAGALALVPQGDRQIGRLEAYLAVGDASGATTPVSRRQVAVDLPLLDAPDFQLLLDLRLAPGENHLAIALRDELSQRATVLRRRVVTGSKPGGWLSSTP